MSNAHTRKRSNAQSSGVDFCFLPIVCLCVLAVVCASADADSITFARSSIPMRGCVIEGVRNGAVHFVDAAGQRQRRELDEIAALGFDDLSSLEAAEQAIAKGDLDGGLRHLLGAMIDAKTDLQRLWVQARLSQVHDLRGEYVQAAGHAAGVMAASNDPHWRALEPASPVDEPEWPAAHEAVERIHAALKAVKAAELRAALERMLKKVEPVRTRLAAARQGSAPPVGGTISGFALDDIQAGTFALPNARSSPAQSPPAAPASIPPAADQSRSSAAPAESNDPESSAALDSLLKAGRWDEALGRCARLSAKPAGRDLAEFLHQYGTALARTGQPRDAAVMFTRCAILYPESPYAPSALIETAVISRDAFHRPEVARRLLEKAAVDAAAKNLEALEMLARELLKSVGTAQPQEP